jgi:integrase
MLDGRYEETTPKDPLFKEARLPCLPPEDHPNRSVAAVAAKFCEFKATTWVTKTLNENRRVLRWFAQLVGPNKPIAAINVEDVRDFRDALMKVPANHSKQKHLEGLSFREIVKIPSTQPPLHHKTRSKYFENLRAFLAWCVKEGYLTSMPGEGIELPANSKVESGRQSFSAEQLGVIFSSPQYAGHRSHTQRSSPGKLVVKDGKFWVPLIALYSGMRLGEVLQLRACDVKWDGAVAFFDVNDRDGQQLKTSSSRRTIPVHPVLVQLGLLSYVNERKEQDKNGRLFPDIKPGKDGYHSHNFSKYFGRYLRRIGSKSRSTSFHSFRHSFTDALRAAKMPEYHVKLLLGHADDSVTAGYGSKPSPSALCADLSKVTYPVVQEALAIHMQTGGTGDGVQGSVPA